MFPFVSLFVFTFHLTEQMFSRPVLFIKDNHHNHKHFVFSLSLSFLCPKYRKLLVAKVFIFGNFGHSVRLFHLNRLPLSLSLFLSFTVPRKIFHPQRFMLTITSVYLYTYTVITQLFCFLIFLSY